MGVLLRILEEAETEDREDMELESLAHVVTRTTP
jgi:hypothetical protein